MKQTMEQIHSFVKKYTRIMKWIPELNMILLTYWLFRTVFLRRDVPFGAVIKAMVISVITALAGAALAHYVLLPLFNGMSQQQLLNYVMPVIGTFVMIPQFITALAKTEGA